MLRKILLVLSIVITISSCVTTRSFNVGVNGLGTDAGILEKTYLLWPSNNVAENQLLFDEVKSYIMKIMKDIGYTYIESGETASIVILVDYGISEPQKNDYSYNSPVFGQTGISSARTTGSAYASGNRITGSSTTTYTPTYGITGYQTVQGSYTTFTRYIKLTAFDFQLFLKSKEEKQLWFTGAASTGSSGDLRLVIPYMITAMKNYVGKNTGKIIEINLVEGSEEVVNLIGK